MKQHRTSSGSQDRQKNKQSQLLSQDENELVFDLLGRKCVTMCTSIIQLFTTEPPLHSQWLKRYTGALCFVKDSVKKSYYCRLYCLLKSELIWEQEMYDDIKIHLLQPYLLAFEGAENLVALNFAEENEADEFFRTVNTVIGSRSRRREEKRSRVKRTPPPRPTTAAPPPKKTEENVFRNSTSNVSSIAPMQVIQQPQSPALPFTNTSYDKKKGSKKLTKADIGMPTNFKHVTHVGWTAQRGFDLTGDDVETLKPFLEKAGVSDQQLNDSETRAFIYDFIQNHNVLESVKSESHPEHSEKQRAPPVPVRYQNGSQRLAPPPPPIRPQAPAPPQPPTRAPPPTIKSQPPVPNSNLMPMPPPPPPPPPPPMAPQMSPPTNHFDQTPNKPTNTNDDVSDYRSALLDSIRQGANLKKVDQSSVSESTSSSSSSTKGNDSRNDLLSAIRQGVELRSAAARELNDPSSRESSGAGTDALADALRRALQERGRVIQSSDEESNDSSDNDGEWDD